MVASASKPYVQRHGPRADELDAATLARCKRGDPLAFRAFVVHYERPVFALISRVVGRPGDVEDLEQETFLRAYRAFGSFDLDSLSRPSAWILTIATRVAIDSRRHDLHALAATEVRAERTAGPTTPEAEHARRELGAAIAAAAAELSPEQRAVFVLAEFHDLSIGEIAAAVGVPESTAKTRLFRARQHMRECLRSIRNEERDGRR